MEKKAKGGAIVQIGEIFVLKEIQFQKQFVAVGRLGVVDRPEMRQLSCSSPFDVFVVVERVAIAVIRMEKRGEIPLTLPPVERTTDQQIVQLVTALDRIHSLKQIIFSQQRGNVIRVAIALFGVLDRGSVRRRQECIVAQRIEIA